VPLGNSSLLQKRNAGHHHLEPSPVGNNDPRKYFHNHGLTFKSALSDKTHPTKPCPNEFYVVPLLHEFRPCVCHQCLVCYYIELPADVADHVSRNHPTHHEQFLHTRLARQPARAGTRISSTSFRASGINSFTEVESKCNERCSDYEQVPRIDQKIVKQSDKVCRSAPAVIYYSNESGSQYWACHYAAEK